MWSSELLHTSSAFDVSFLDLGHLRRYVRDLVLICDSLMTSDVRHLFICLIAICIIFLG